MKAQAERLLLVARASDDRRRSNDESPPGRQLETSCRYTKDGNGPSLPNGKPVGWQAERPFERDRNQLIFAVCWCRRQW